MTATDNYSPYTSVPELIAAWERQIAVGLVGYRVALDLRRAGLAGLEALAPWLQRADDAALVRARPALARVLAPWAQATDGVWYSPDDEREIDPVAMAAELSATARAAWRRALAALRRHAPADMTYRVVLKVAAVHTTETFDPDDYYCNWRPEQVWEEDPETSRRAMVICYQPMYVAVVMKTPYIIERTASGRFRRAGKPRRWPLDRAARPGFDALLARNSLSWPRRSPEPWVVVFESERRIDEKQDWQDGRESLTASRDGLLPGRAVEVRPQRDDDPWPSERHAVLPSGSLLAGQTERQIDQTLGVCEAMERLLATQPANTQAQREAPAEEAGS